MSNTTARQALRSATSECHQRVDTVFSTADLGERASYGRFLTAQADAHLAIEAALEQGGIATVMEDWPRRRRGDQLRQDLADLGLAVPDLPGDPLFESPEALLGALYVLEGSRLGGTLLSRSVPSGLPKRFLGNVDSAAWQSLLKRLDEALDTEAKRAVAIDAAKAVFARFEASGRRHLA